MTARETFERVRDHLLAQGRPAQCSPDGSSSNSWCRYRLTVETETEDVPRILRCAVGCLLPDDPERIARCEGSSVHDVRPGPKGWDGTGPVDHGSPSTDTLAELLNEGGVPASEEMRALLMDLQAVHDREGPSRWPELLEFLSRKHATVLGRPSS